MARFGTASCSVCGFIFNLKMDGTVYPHYTPDTKDACPGSSKPPEVTEITEDQPEYEVLSRGVDGQPDRISVPLQMIPGNLEILLENKMPCTGFSLKRIEGTRNDVMLVIHGIERETAEALGFKTMKMG